MGLSAVVARARCQLRPPSRETYTQQKLAPSATTMEVATKFFASCGLTARKVSTNGLFGLSLEICVPTETEIPETCVFDVDVNANPVVTATSSKIPCTQ